MVSMTSQTTTTTRRQSHQAQAESAPETFELSIKTPGRSLRELSRRIAGPSRPQESSDEDDNAADDFPPATAQSVVQRWNSPKTNIGRLGFAFFSFVIAGLNDGAVGVRSDISPIQAGY